MALTHIFRIGIGLVLLLLPFGPRCLAGDNGVVSRSIETVKTDFGNFYLDPGNLTKIGFGVAGAAVLANMGVDRWIRNKYQDDLRSRDTNHATSIFNLSNTGLVLVTMPVYLASYGFGSLIHNPTMEDWAQKSFRATVVGGPALVLLAGATGADRPTEGNSHWKPFHNFHGVSGHAFVGGIPFITAAKLTENPYEKAVFYGLSTVTGLSRINDDKHYFSQVALGWFLAYLSCDAVKRGDDRQPERMHVQLAPVPKGLGMTVQRQL